MRLPWLLRWKDVRAAGLSDDMIDTLRDCGSLGEVKPKGSGKARYQKWAVARVLGRESWLPEGGLKQEPLLLRPGDVQRLTGWSAHTVRNIVYYGGLPVRCVAGLKLWVVERQELAKMLGLEE